MKRFVVPLIALFALLSPLIARAQHSEAQNWGTFISFHTVWMRNTSAAAVARQGNWSVGGFSGGTTSGFADSSVFRRGAATATLYDTSCAIPVVTIPLPPLFGAGFPAALQDSVLPWFIFRVGQDTLAYGSGATTTTGMDSIRVAVEVSYDGVDWYAMGGTPTTRFDTVYLTTGSDGTQSPTLVGVEVTPGMDHADVSFKCRASTYDGVGTIMNLEACQYPFIRFIIGIDSSGQYKVEIGTWANLDVLD